MNNNRFLQFEGTFNFRDIGGLQTTDNKNMKSGILFRSGELSWLSSNDLNKLQELNIKLICDLRTPNERKSKPDKIPASNGIRIVNVPFYYNNKDLSNREFYSLLLNRSKELDFEVMIKEIYHEIAFKHTAQINEVLKLISDPDNLPMLIHCTGGKDRTGVISAVIQLLMGIDKEKVLEDYLISNAFIEQRVKRTLKFIRWMSLFRISPERIKPMLIVRRDYLEDVLEIIFKQHKTVEEYLLRTCGVNQTCIRSLKKLLAE